MQALVRQIIIIVAIGSSCCLLGCDIQSNEPRQSTVDVVRPHFVRQCAWAGRGVWLKADLHVHTRFSDGALSIAEVVEEGLRHGCDVMAITDHGDSNLTAGTPEYFAAIEASRRLHPQLILLAGLEWNVPPWRGREHATLLAPDGVDQESLLSEFKLRFDDWQRDDLLRDPQAGVAALRWLSHQAALERTEPAVILYNHPSRKRSQSNSLVDELALLCSASSSVIGFEGAPGHQRAAEIGAYEGGLKTADRWDPAAAIVGNTWDQLLQRGVDAWAAVASSDFHGRTGPYAKDYWPGEFAATWLYAPDRSAAGALAALRAGAFFAVHGDIAREIQFSADAEGLPRPAIAGEAIRTAVGDEMTVRITGVIPDHDWQNELNRIDEVELIMVTQEGAKSVPVESVGERAGDWSTTFRVAPGGCAIRARGRRILNDGPDLLFYTNPIRIAAPDLLPTQPSTDVNPPLDRLEQPDRE